VYEKRKIDNVRKREREREQCGIVCNVHLKQILLSKGNRIRIANDQKPKTKFPTNAKKTPKNLQII